MAAITSDGSSDGGNGDSADSIDNGASSSGQADDERDQCTVRAVLRWGQMSAL